MSIEIYDQPAAELKAKILSMYDYSHEVGGEIPPENVDNIKKIFTDGDIRNFTRYFQDLSQFNNLSYDQLAKLEEASRILTQNLTEIKEQIDLELFFKKGYNLDVTELKNIYKEKNLDKQFPELDFDKIKEMYIKPPRSLITYYDRKKKISIDSFVFRKYMIAVLQMIFNHMDIVVCNIGDEGAGKSCKNSQDMYVLWWMMTEMKLINYPFEIKQMFANTLKGFSDLEDKYYGVPFRIISLDEGNELNRQDWKEEPVKLFWQRLRRERHERRIKFINIPVLGEMILNIVLSRVNFIFNMVNKNTPKTGTLLKGDYDFYIIPRGDKIYSPDLNKNLTKEEIKNKLYMNLKDKEYLKGMPKDIRIKRCHCNGVWAFREKDYLKEMKESNKQYRVGRTIKLGMTELYCLYKARFTPRKAGIEPDNHLYPSLNMVLHRIRKFWENDPELLLKYEYVMGMKSKEKEVKKNAKSRGRRMGEDTPQPKESKEHKTPAIMDAD